MWLTENGTRNDKSNANMRLNMRLYKSNKYSCKKMIERFHRIRLYSYSSSHTASFHFHFFDLFIKINIHMQRQMYIVQKCTCFYFSIVPQNIVKYFLCALETAFHIFDLTFVRACMCVLACAAAVVRFDSDPIFFRTKFVNIHYCFFLFAACYVPWTATVRSFGRFLSLSSRMLWIFQYDSMAHKKGACTMHNGRIVNWIPSLSLIYRSFFLLWISFWIVNICYHTMNGIASNRISMDLFGQNVEKMSHPVYNPCSIAIPVYHLNMYIVHSIWNLFKRR